MPSALSTYFSQIGSVLPDFILHMKYFPKAIFATIAVTGRLELATPSQAEAALLHADRLVAAPTRPEEGG